MFVCVRIILFVSLVLILGLTLLDKSKHASIAFARLTSNKNHNLNLLCFRQQKWGLNTYLYAPKDDYKHRMFWREMYSVEEAGDISYVL